LAGRIEVCSSNIWLEEEISSITMIGLERRSLMFQWLAGRRDLRYTNGWLGEKISGIPMNDWQNRGLVWLEK